MNENRTFWNQLCVVVCTTGLSGFVPGWIFGRQGLAGGTMGALVALGVQWWLRNASPWLVFSLTVGSFILGCLMVHDAEEWLFKHYGGRRRHTGKFVQSDFNETNIDEFHGQLLAGLPLWFMHLNDDPRTFAVLLILSFVLFRVLDAKKPGYIGRVEKRFTGTAFGIMVDDTAAAIPPFMLLFLSIFAYSIIMMWWLIALLALAIVGYRLHKR
jgi:phosphatidylglycerophosphatase A